MKKLQNILKGDKVIWVIFFFLSLISLVAVYSSIGLSAVRFHHSPLLAFCKHLIFVIATYVVVIAISHLNYRRFSQLSPLLYLLSLVLLGITMVLHSRWLTIPYLGRFQPSEFAKIVMVIYLARELTVKSDRLQERSTFNSLLLSIGIVAAFILPENFSTSALVCIVCFIMMYFGDVNIKYWRFTLFIVLIIAVVGLSVAYTTYRNKYANLATPEEKQAVEEENNFLGRSVTWGHRVESWIHPDTDEISQENMARMAVASGKFFGVGIGSTVHARLMTEAHNDFIYAIIIEEKGMMAGIAIFILYSWLYFRCIKISIRCKGRFGALTAMGLGTLIYIQALVNMSVDVGLLPVTGQTLPFISAGGTAYLCMGGALGIIQSIAYDTIKAEKAEKEEEEAGLRNSEENETSPGDE